MKAEARGASIGPARQRVRVEATIFGASGDLGRRMFSVEIVFPPDFPDSPPHPIPPPIFHPKSRPPVRPSAAAAAAAPPPSSSARPPRARPSAPGVPYLRTLLLWSTIEPKEKTPAPPQPARPAPVEGASPSR